MRGSSERCMRRMAEWDSNMTETSITVYQFCPGHLYLDLLGGDAEPCDG